MKIQVIGENSAASSLRDHLSSLGYWLARFGADFTVRLSEHDLPAVLIEGQESVLSTEAVRLVKELSPLPVEFRVAPKSSGQELHIRFQETAKSAVEIGVLRALLVVTGHGVSTKTAVQPSAPLGWFKRLFK